jgi:hypothetical protein
MTSPSPKATASSSGPLPVLDRRTTPASLTSEQLIQNIEAFVLGSPRNLVA